MHNRLRQPSRYGRLLVAAAALVAATTIAACGSSSKPPAIAGNGHNAGLEFARCIRSHGVPSFPDPETNDAPQIPIGLAKNPSPAFTAALDACKHLMPDAHPPAVSARQKAAAVKLAQCMRAHGVPNYPDPTYKNGQLVPPSLVDPSINQASPAFSAASKKCQA
jgi:hypothetical protein